MHNAIWGGGRLHHASHGSIADLIRGKWVPRRAQVAYVLRELITRSRFMSWLMVLSGSATRAAAAVPLPICRQF